VGASVHRENSLLSSGRRVSEEDTHRVVEHSVESSARCAFEKVARRAQSFPFERNRRVETLRSVWEIEIFEEIKLRRDNARSVWETDLF
jgi:hypothetical protein